MERGNHSKNEMCLKNLPDQPPNPNLLARPCENILTEPTPWETQQSHSSGEGTWRWKMVTGHVKYESKKRKACGNETVKHDEGKKWRMSNAEDGEVGEAHARGCMVWTIWHVHPPHLAAMSSSSPPQPQYWLGKPFIFMYWSGVTAETPPKYCG